MYDNQDAEPESQFIPQFFPFTQVTHERKHDILASKYCTFVSTFNDVERTRFVRWFQAQVKDHAKGYYKLKVHLEFLMVLQSHIDQGSRHSAKDEDREVVQTRMVEAVQKLVENRYCRIVHNDLVKVYSKSSHLKEVKKT
jgi:hypothetical protein